MTKVLKLSDELREKIQKSEFLSGLEMCEAMRYYRMRVANGDSWDAIDAELGVDPSKAWPN